MSTSLKQEGLNFAYLLGSIEVFVSNLVHINVLKSLSSVDGNETFNSFYYQPCILRWLERILKCQSTFFFKEIQRYYLVSDLKQVHLSIA